MNRYIPLIREFAAREGLFHGTVARKLGLHATDEHVLRLLGERAMTASALAEYTGLTGAAMTAVVDRLEASGYVTRERDTGDRRRITIRAVPAKLRKLNQLYAGQSAAMSNLLSKYKDAEFAAIMEYLTQTIRVLTEQTAKLRDDRMKE
jgi:DNA-binding MarR family transcriptional regulator